MHMVLEPSLSVLVICVCDLITYICEHVHEDVLSVCGYMNVLGNACVMHTVCVSDKFVSLHTCI